MVKQKKTKHTGRNIAIVIVVLALIGAAALIGPTILARRLAASANTIKQTVAKTGTIEKTATGTGHVTSEDTFADVLISLGVVIDEVAVEPGDAVMAGDILATLDETALQQLIWDRQAELAELDNQLDKVKNDTESVYIRSTISGRVKQILADEGDDVAAVMRKHGALMVLSGDGRMVVRFVPADPALGEELAVGDDVTVILADGTEKDGEMRSFSSAVWEATLSDNGPVAGEAATVWLDKETLLGEGLLEISRPLTITGTDGQIEDILRDVDERVQIDSSLFKLSQAAESREAVRLYTEREDKTQALNQLLDYSHAPVIAAPAAGTIESVLIESGQTITAAATESQTLASQTPASQTTASQTTASQTAKDDMVVVLTMKTTSKMQLKVDIDELDVAALVVGQPAAITVDALPALEINGSIAEIAETGTIGQSGTTFQVTLDLTIVRDQAGRSDAAGLPADQNLKTGMSATATITVDRREQVVTLPLEALQEAGDEQFVYVGTAVDEASLGEKRQVVTGISDGTTVEIVEGLQAGETVSYRYVTGDESFMPFGNRDFRNQTEEGGSSRP